MNAYSKKYKYMIKYHAKSGCTLLRKLFLELHNDELYEKDDNIFTSLHEYFRYSENEEINLKIHLVRNPYMRIVSMFINKMCGGYNMAILNNFMKLEKHTFYHFVKYLYENKDFIYEMDIHLHPQYREYQSDDIIVKLENFNKEIIKAYNKENFSTLIPRIEKFLLTDKKNEDFNISDKLDESIGFVGLVEYDINSCGPWSDYKDFYNNKIKEMVYEIYKDDFVTFGYLSDIL